MRFSIAVFDSYIAILFTAHRQFSIAFCLTYPILGGLFFQSGLFIQALLIPVFFIIRAGFEYGADIITAHTFGSDGMPALNFAGVMMHEICLSIMITSIKHPLVFVSLVLSDVMWYAQDRFSPAAMIDLATLTGAIIVALGSQNAGLFSNDDTFCNAISAAALREAEGVWRMPLSKDYDAQINSDVADMANMGKVGRSGGSIVAAQFLQRFVKENTPWAHLDIAGVTYSKKGADYSPSGATGWGVMTLNRLVKDMMEAG